MYHMLNALVRWLAPVLSFTAEEIWSYMPGKKSASVFLQTWYNDWPTLPAAGVTTQVWEQILAIRDLVKQELEKLRVEGEIGSSLDAEIDLYANESVATVLRALKDELRFVFITSYARVHPLEQKPAESTETAMPGLYVNVKPSAYAKCVRCWHHRDDAGASAAHPGLCGRCVTNLGAGESRSYA
jgi:isoleucyl-tRNA synthetase